MHLAVFVTLVERCRGVARFVGMFFERYEGGEECALIRSSATPQDISDYDLLVLDNLEEAAFAPFHDRPVRQKHRRIKGATAMKLVPFKTVRTGAGAHNFTNCSGSRHHQALRPKLHTPSPSKIRVIIEET